MLFDVVVSGHYVLPNWTSITSVSQWQSFLLEYPDVDPFYQTEVPDIWLTEYRATPKGFSAAAAFLEPFGVIVAAASLLLLLRARARETSAAGDIVFCETKG